MRSRPLTVAAAMVATGAALAGCLPDRGPNTASPTESLAAPSPAPTVTVTRASQQLAAGDTADFDAQAGVSLRLTASTARVSRTRLSRSYGSAPARGYYVTFTISIVNTGSRPVAIGPPNFHLRIPGEGVVTAYDGNAPYSGASSQLDSTELGPGERLRAPLTFDVRRPHGTLLYLPDRSAAVVWRF